MHRRLAQASFEKKSKYEGNTTKLNKKSEATQEEEVEEGPRISPYVMYFVLFVLVGSSIVGAIEAISAMSKK